MRGFPGGERAFELRVVPLERERYGLALFQQAVRSRGKEDVSFERVIQVRGDALRAVIDDVLSALRRAGYRATDLARNRRAPFSLPEEDAVRLGLLLAAVQPLRKLSRIEAIAREVRGMEPEELYYWYSKATAAEGGRRARRAFRLLASEE